LYSLKISFGKSGAGLPPLNSCICLEPKTVCHPHPNPPPTRGRGLNAASWGWVNMPDLVILSRNLRKRQTDAENLLWRNLRGKQVEGLRFRRQQPIGRYIVDFVCLERRLILEIDGGQHAIEIEKDEERSNWLIAEGYSILRFWNNDVLTNLEGVLETIRLNVLSNPDNF
jgi:very-short-patch-repair endonuclease